MTDSLPTQSELPARGAFPTTRWSLISSVRDDDLRANEALAHLCRAYWQPIYVYARRRGNGADQAEDLTQGFFTKLLEKNYVAQARKQRGRFRTFLLTAFNNYMANEWDRAQAKKRGGASTVLSLDFETAEGRLQLETADMKTPEELFVRQWAQTLLDRAFDKLAESEKAGDADRFERLKSCLTGSEPSVPYRQLADELGMTESAVKVAVHRMRKRFAQIVRGEVAETVEDATAVTDEIAFLIEALQE